MKSLLAIFISSVLVVSGYSQTRNVLVNSNNAVVSPTNFWSVDASNARTGLGLGTAATNPASAFQPSSATLSNLSSSNAVNLTNLRATNIVGVIPASNISSTTLTNIPATNIVGTVALASNISGTLAISNGGTGATNAATARTNLGATTIGNAVFTATNSSAAINAIGISTNFSDQVLSVETLVLPEATGLSSATANGIQFRSIYPSSNGLVALSGTDDQGQTTFRISTGTMSGTTAEVALFNSNRITFYKPLEFNNTTNAATTRTNLELGATWLTNDNVTNFRTSIGLGATNDVSFDEMDVRYVSIEDGGGGVIIASNGIGFFGTNVAGVSGLTRTNLGLGSTNSVTFGPAILSKLNFSNSSIDIGATSSTTVDLTYISNSLLSVGLSGVSFGSTSFATVTRTNLGLGWTALTNSNAGTGLVSVNTNGEVVSPTNFWQVAPIVTRFVEFDPPTNASTNIVAARNLHIHSLAISRTGVTSTIALPTNNVFNGDIALVVHQGPTSSVTAIRQAGSGTNFITLNQPEQAVEFVYYNNVWQFNHNLSYIEPIFFSGTNAATNAAASRTNLGLGWLALTNPQSSLYSGTATKLLGYVPEINPSSSNLTGYNVLAYTNTNSLVIPANILIGEDLAGGPRNTRNVELNGTLTIKTPFSSPTTIYANNAITATDDSSYTNVLVSFISNSVGFSNVTASGTLTATSTVTAKTNLVVEGFVNFTTNHTNSNPATNNQIQKFLQIRIGTNAFFLPLYQ